VSQDVEPFELLVRPVGVEHGLELLELSLNCFHSLGDEDFHVLFEVLVAGVTSQPVVTVQVQFVLLHWWLPSRVATVIPRLKYLVVGFEVSMHGPLFESLEAVKPKLEGFVQESAQVLLVWVDVEPQLVNPPYFGHLQLRISRVKGFLLLRLHKAP